jgi:drug/metabolite transporter (DMT)-like permease
VTWGAADFAAGLVTRTLGAFMTVALTQAVGLAGAATLVVLTGEPVPPPEALAWGLAAGVVGLVGASAFYRVLADGRMSIGSPLVAVIGAGLPVLVALLFGERLPPSDLAGIVLGLIAVVLVSMPARSSEQRDHGRLDRRLLALAILAGAGLASFFLLVDRSAALGAGPWWILT